MYSVDFGPIYAVMPTRPVGFQIHKAGFNEIDEIKNKKGRSY
jgi:hypothetical protein